MGTGQEQVKRELLLDGLDCANCALKIENGVSKIKGIHECSVNFVTKTLSMYTTSDMDEQVVEEANRKVLSIITIMTITMNTRMESLILIIVTLIRIQQMGPAHTSIVITVTDIPMHILMNMNTDRNRVTVMHTATRRAVTLMQVIRTNMVPDRSKRC